MQNNKNNVMKHQTYTVVEMFYIYIALYVVWDFFWCFELIGLFSRQPLQWPLLHLPFWCFTPVQLQCACYNNNNRHKCEEFSGADLTSPEQSSQKLYEDCNWLLDICFIRGKVQFQWKKRYLKGKNFFCNIFCVDGF